jgi:hypothetical protein
VRNYGIIDLGNYSAVVIVCYHEGRFPSKTRTMETYYSEYQTDTAKNEKPEMSE